jgi:hypothetical protein
MWCAVLVLDTHFVLDCSTPTLLCSTHIGGRLLWARTAICLLQLLPGFDCPWGYSPVLT